MFDNDMNLSDILAPLPWEDFKVHGLMEIMRQKDQEFAKLLNSIHIKIPEDSEEDIILQSCEVNVDCNHGGLPCECNACLCKKYGIFRLG